jgi:hypothetical protein
MEFGGAGVAAAVAGVGAVALRRRHAERPIVVTTAIKASATTDQNVT